MRQLPGQLPRWRAWWLLIGRPKVLLPIAVVLLAALALHTWLPVGLTVVLTVAARLGYVFATGGRRVGGRRRPELARLVAEAASSVGAPVPIRIGLVAAPVVAARGRYELLIGAPLADRLSAEELRALVAHELSVLARPELEIMLHGLWSRSAATVDPSRYATRVLRELDEFAAAVEQYGDHAAGHVTDPATAARAVARAWLIATAEGMPVRTVEWSPSLALRSARRHPDLTESLLALVGTKLTTARPEAPVPLPA